MTYYNYPKLHAHDDNYPQLHHVHQCYAHAPVATHGGRSGPDGPLGACMIYWDPAEALRRQQSLLRARHRLIAHRGAISESLYKKIEPCSKFLRTHTSTYKQAVARHQKGLSAKAALTTVSE